jgi:hypothetical protein
VVEAEVVDDVAVVDVAVGFVTPVDVDAGPCTRSCGEPDGET